MYSQVQNFIVEDKNNNFSKKYQSLSNTLFNLLDTPVKSTHHIGGTKHFNYPTEPILDILVGVDNLHDITALDEKRLNYAGFYRLHHPYKKKVVMAQFNNLIELKQIARLHIIQKDSTVYNDYLATTNYLANNLDEAHMFGENKQNIAERTSTIRAYDNQKQQLFSKLIKQLPIE
ncbi:GrpB family protein [Staphylococcus sp. ACRSN]|uniref:GrpB family protein n=1 Tax=Staphylococcus sp. ACRSN TaxID=2918214 RepID=UPI001EF2FD92|nr:GrpB family protein [Staphylococcus sp. ACRSN]MCG7340057.1 GrpB family protein [Staphylococcus sp. ACRSN]